MLYGIRRLQQASLRLGLRQSSRHTQCRHLLTLAIETSCDDTCVAILEKQNVPPTLSNSVAATHPQTQARLLFHDKITAVNVQHGGIHPIVSLDSHWANLAKLVDQSVSHLPDAGPDASDGRRVYLKDGSVKQKPDFVSVTRGPGMRSNLVCGLDTAKGLATAWQIPMLGIHHMQAHALTPRLVHALSNRSTEPGVKPAFPFLTLLVSGGHTMLLHSKSLTSHSILASTGDIAIGDALDKVGRAILPAHLRSAATDTAYAKHLSNYAFPSHTTYSSYPIPLTRIEEIHKPTNKFGWSISHPLADTRDLAFSFGGLASQTTRLAAKPTMTDEERLLLARTTLGIACEHLACRTIIALQSLRTPISTLVVSGGVASNSFLRHFLATILKARGFGDIQLVFPPVELCTDNAAMIAWAGMEMYEAGYRTELSVAPIRTWSMDDEAEEGAGGILGVDGWEKVADVQKE